MKELFKFAKSIIGLKEESVIDKLMEIDALYRIEERDGFPIETTDDFRVDRLTLKVNKGIIKEANIS